MFSINSINSISIIRPLTAITNFIKNKFITNEYQNTDDDLENGVVENEQNKNYDTKYTLVIFDIHEYLASLV